MATGTQRRATIDDLYREEGKAELINGRIERPMPSGILPARVAEEIFVNLRQYVKRIKKGEAKADGVGYAVPKLPSGRESFSPDVSYYAGPVPSDLMRFFDGPPAFAVEVRSQSDYGPAAEERLAAKRYDYFTAGTQVVWNVDPVAECIHVYRKSAPDSPQTLRKGEIADAEPAVPGWQLALDEIFPKDS
jgi:Uma2 family endonuclease